MNSPSPLFRNWSSLVKRMRAAPRRILLTDFDGTLARLRRSPEDAHLSKAARRLLVRIRDAGDTVGVVSGRGLEDLLGRVRLSGIWYAASHGYSLRDPRGRTICLATAAEQRRVRRAIKWIAPRLARVKGTQLDVKREALAVHYRAASPRAAAKAEALVRELLEFEPGLRLLSGKKVWELLPGNSINKWTAVKRLLAEEKASKGAFVIYLGDDKTDESIFRGMRHGVSVVVGRRSDTAARYWVRSNGDVQEFLRRWLKVEREEAAKKTRRSSD